MDPQLLDFAHPKLNEGVSAIGGEYQFTAERQIDVDGRPLLYYTGFFMIDRSCCGISGCAYALVAGFVREWKFRINDCGRPVSRVAPVRSPDLQKRVAAMIQQQDPLMQVSFLPGARKVSQSVRPWRRCCFLSTRPDT